MRVSLSNKVSGLALIFFIYRKNHTHEGGHTSEFPLDIYWWTLKNPKNQNFEQNVKKNAGDIIILHVCTKTTIIWGNEVQFLRYGVKQDFFVILGHFLPFYPSHPQQPRKPKFWKNERSFWRCHHFKLVHQKHDHMMCLLRHGVGQKIFCHFCHFCSFTPLFNPKIKIFKKWKKHLEIS